MAKRGRPPHPDVLTPREWEVLGCIRDGLSNEQIADRLGISLDGVKYHVTEILTKLGLENRHDAARWQPGAPRPWWALAFLFRPRWLAPAISGGLAAGGLLGAGLMVWALVATGGCSSGGKNGGATSTSELVARTTPKPTAMPVSPPPTPTPPPPTEAPPIPTLPPTPDRRTPIRDLPTADQIQLGPDGKYFLPDRGDGCRWDEYLRMNDGPEFGETVLLSTDCLVDFAIEFRLESREVLMLIS